MILLPAGCSHSSRGVRPFLDDHYPDQLSQWQLFAGKLRELKPNDGVVPYDVNTPLFSDYATKFRTVWMPRGAAGRYRADGVFDLPAGAILSKTFAFGDRLIETRLYIHKANGWAGITYVWNREQTEAALDVTPEPVPVSSNGMNFDYSIPNVNQCKTCHEGPAGNGPLGITARNLNRSYNYAGGTENQLSHWTRIGYLKDAPASEQAPKPGSDLESRARAYMDVNCGTCHVAGGRGAKSGVFLTASETSRWNLGVCRVSADTAGSYDIVPGRPQQSVLLQRMQSMNPKLTMPSLGHDVVHKEGVALISDWIAHMRGTCPAI